MPGRFQRAPCRRHWRCQQAGQVCGSAASRYRVRRSGPARYHQCPSAGDGIGRRSGLKTRSRKVYGFESRPAHQGSMLGVAKPCRLPRGMCWRARPPNVGVWVATAATPRQMDRAHPFGRFAASCSSGVLRGGTAEVGPARRRSTLAGAALDAPRMGLSGQVGQIRPRQTQLGQARPVSPNPASPATLTGRADQSSAVLHVAALRVSRC